MATQAKSNPSESQGPPRSPLLVFMDVAEHVVFSNLPDEDIAQCKVCGRPMYKVGDSRTPDKGPVRILYKSQDRHGKIYYQPFAYFWHECSKCGVKHWIPWVEGHVNDNYCPCQTKVNDPWPVPTANDYNWPFVEKARQAHEDGAKTRQERAGASTMSTPSLPDAEPMINALIELFAGHVKTALLENDDFRFERAMSALHALKELKNDDELIKNPEKAVSKED